MENGNVESSQQNVESSQQNVLMAAIELTPKQIESMNSHHLDFNSIKSLQTIDRWPKYGIQNDIVGGWGRNFENAVYVGTRLNNSDKTQQDVFLKNDGWFMTSYDGTNCNPITDERDKPILKENGYIFMDMVQLGLLNNLKGTADFARALASFLSARAVETEKLGGKTRKHGKRKSRKSKRRYRK